MPLGTAVENFFCHWNYVSWREACQ